MSWNNGGPNPWGTPGGGGSNGGDKPPPGGPWGGGPNDERPGPRRPGGPFGGGGGPIPDLDRMIAQVQAYIRRLLGGGSGVLVLVGLLALGWVEGGPSLGRMALGRVLVGADASEGLGADALARARRRMVGEEVAGEEVEGVVVVGLVGEERSVTFLTFPRCPLTLCHGPSTTLWVVPLPIAARQGGIYPAGSVSRASNPPRSSLSSSDTVPP